MRCVFGAGYVDDVCVCVFVTDRLWKAAKRPRGNGVIKLALEHQNQDRLDSGHQFFKQTSIG